MVILRSNNDFGEGHLALALLTSTSRKTLSSSSNASAWVSLDLFRVVGSRQGIGRSLKAGDFSYSGDHGSSNANASTSRDTAPAWDVNSWAHCLFPDAGQGLPCGVGTSDADEYVGLIGEAISRVVEIDRWSCGTLLMIEDCLG